MTSALGSPPAPVWITGSTAAVTGLGPMPGTDPLEAARTVAGELADFPHLPHLPGRGPSGSAAGRTAALLVDVHVDLQPSGWRVTDRAGRDEIRARSALASDLDAAEQVWDGYAGPFKVQAQGPFTLAVSLDRPRGDAVLADSGARRDVGESLAEGLRQHVADLRRRIPGALPVVQVDEPLLADVLAGAVPTTSGFGRLREVTDAEVRTTLASIANAVAPAPLIVSVGHHLQTPAPGELPTTLLWDALDGAGLAGLGLDPAAADAAGLERLAGLVESGVTAWLSMVQVHPPAGPPVRPQDVARAVVDLWARLGFAPHRAVADIVITPDGGLGTVSYADARRILGLLAAVGPAIAEDAGSRS